jgi:predicted amidohydrolase YtcJ
VKPGQGDDFYQHNGAGEMLVFSAADFEDFRQSRAEIPSSMKDDLTPVVSHLVKNRWPFRMHATYDETIGQALDVFEAVHRVIPFDGLHWFFDHAETVSDANLARIAALGGGIAVQHRMAYQGEYFVARYGQEAACSTPPIKRMLEMGVKVGAGTDATRVASYDPWNALYWMVTGKTVSGLALYPTGNLLDRTTALRLYTQANTWFSNEEGKKGQVMIGQLADMAVLSADYLTVPEEDIRQLVSVLTMVGGRVVHASDDFANLSPELPPAMPDWSPARTYDGYYKRYQRPTNAASQTLDAAANAACGCNVRCNVHGHAHARAGGAPSSDRRGFWGALGCACWAV